MQLQQFICAWPHQAAARRDRNACCTARRQSKRTSSAKQAGMRVQLHQPMRSPVNLVAACQVVQHESLYCRARWHGKQITMLLSQAVVQKLYRPHAG
jgi:hypothetical protein